MAGSFSYMGSFMRKDDFDLMMARWLPGFRRISARRWTDGEARSGRSWTLAVDASGTCGVVDRAVLCRDCALPLRRGPHDAAAAMPHVEPMAAEFLTGGRMALDPQELAALAGSYRDRGRVLLDMADALERGLWDLNAVSAALDGLSRNATVRTPTHRG